MIEVEESNVLIAKFMGWKETTETPKVANVPDYKILVNKNGVGKLRMRTPTEIGELFFLQYDSSWEWLMPVFEKIAKYKYEDNDSAYCRTFGMINQETGGVMVRINRMPLHEADSLLEATYMAIVDWIKWHNTK